MRPALSRCTPANNAPPRRDTPSANVSRRKRTWWGRIGGGRLGSWKLTRELTRGVSTRRARSSMRSPRASPAGRNWCAGCPTPVCFEAARAWCSGFSHHEREPVTAEAAAQNRVALVTGGANGIGARVARRLAEAGARVVIADVDSTAGERLAGELAGVFVRCDVSRADDNRSAVDSALERFGGIDIAFLNAGVGQSSPLLDGFDDASYRQMIGVNLDGVVYGLVAVLPALRARGGGDVVVTASLAGLTPMPMDAVYTATKHAVGGLVRSVAVNCAGVGMRVNELCPGVTDSAMIE